MSIKKNLSIMLIISIMMTSFVTAFAADTDDTDTTADEAQQTESAIRKDAPYYRAVKVLSALGIMQGKSENDFAAEDTLTRAEMSAVAVRLFGMDSDNQSSTKSGFADVADDYWGKNSINTAFDLGLVNGNGDGTFSPEDEVTAEQAVKIIVCALGYEPKAQSKGAYPGGYLATGSELGLFEDISFSDGYSNPLPRWKAAMLVYNALEVQLMEVKSYGENKSSVVSDNKTALGTYLKTEKKTGVITATYSASIDNDDLEPGDVLIDDTVYTTSLDMSDYIGYSVDFYCTIETGNKKNEIIVFFPVEGSNSTTEIDFDDVTSVKVSDSFAITVDYYTNDGKKGKSLTLTKPVIMYNGKAEEFASADELQDFLDDNMNQGQLRVVKDKDNSYKDILFVENYDAYPVATIDAENMRIGYTVYSAGRSDVKVLDLSNENNPDAKVFFYNEDDEEIQLSDIQVGDVIMIYASADKELYKIYQSKKQVTGEITQKNVVPGTTPEPTPAPTPKPTPTPKPQPYWEMIQELNMDDFTPEPKDYWSFGGNQVIDGREVFVAADGAGRMLHQNSGLYTTNELMTDRKFDGKLANIDKNKPAEVGDKMFLLDRGVITASGNWDWYIRWPSPGSAIRVKNFFDKSKIAAGDKIKITAWVYAAQLYENYGNGKPNPHESADQTSPTKLRMWLAGVTEAGDNNHCSGAPDMTKRPNECTYDYIPTGEWTEVSFTYTVDTYTAYVSSIRMDSRLDDAIDPDALGLYPRKLVLGAVKAEKYIDPNAGQEEEIIPDPRPDVPLDLTDYGIYIDKEKYLPVSSFPSSLLEIGQTVTLLLDRNGKIAGYKADLAKSGYGMIMDVCKINGGFNKGIMVKIMDAGGNISTYETKEEITAYDGTNVTKVPAQSLIANEPIDAMTTHYIWSTDNAANFQEIPRTWLTDEQKSKAASRKLVYYEANSKGQLHTILVPSIPEDNPDCKIKMVKDFEYDESNRGKSILYYSYYPRFLTHAYTSGRLEPVYRLALNCPKWIVWSEDYEEANYTTYNGNLWEENSVNNKKWYQAQLYRLPGSKTIDFIVMNPDGVYGRGATNVIVDNIEETPDGYVLNGYNPRLSVTSNNNFSMKLKKDLRLFENIWMTSPNSDAVRLTLDNIADYVGTLPFNVSYESEAMGGGTTPYVKPGSLNAGDVVRVVSENNEITYLEVIRRVDVGLAQQYSSVGYGNSDGFFDKDYGFLNGVITDVNHKLGLVKVKGWYWPGADLPISSSSAKYTQASNTSDNYISELEITFPVYVNTTVWDEERDYYRVGTLRDFEVGDLLYVVGQIDYPIATIIFKNHKYK